MALGLPSRGDHAAKPFPRVVGVSAIVFYRAPSRIVKTFFSEKCAAVPIFLAGHAGRAVAASALRRTDNPASPTPTSPPFTTGPVGVDRGASPTPSLSANPIRDRRCRGFNVRCLRTKSRDGSESPALKAGANASNAGLRWSVAGRIKLCQRSRPW